MKVCLVSYFGLSNVGGVERVCTYIKDILVNKGHEVVIIDRAELEKSTAGRIFKILFEKIPSAFRGIISSKICREMQAQGDYIITNGYNCPFVHADILFIHGTMKAHNIALGKRNSLHYRLLCFYEQSAARRAKKVVSVSQCALDEVERYYSKSLHDKYVLNNMVDANIFYPKNVSDEHPHPMTILFCGGLSIRKGLKKILELCEFIHQNEVGCSFYIASPSTSKTDGILKSFADYSFVKFFWDFGIEKINDFYNMGDVMFFPSLYEGFEMVTLESLCAGIPVLGNSVGAVKELTDRKEPGVEIISDPTPASILRQLKSLASEYNTTEKKKVLHEWYGQQYGRESYMSRLANLLP